MLQHLLQSAQARNARLIAVSKTHPPERILALYHQGQRLFGENKVQEMVEKAQALPSDIAWHMIGHLQTNKVRYIAPFVAMIHAVDSLRLLEEINKQARNNNRVIDCLLQFRIAREETKFGMEEAEGVALLENPAYRAMQNVRICGVMGMASFTDDTVQIRAEFRQLKAVFEVLKQRFFADSAYFKEISMGMSGDWEIALEEGSTLLRIGSLLFGNRL